MVFAATRQLLAPLILRLSGTAKGCSTARLVGELRISEQQVTTLGQRTNADPCRVVRDG
jgi:hypothetical protein